MQRRKTTKRRGEGEEKGERKLLSGGESLESGETIREERNSWRRGNDVATWQDQTEEERGSHILCNSLFSFWASKPPKQASDGVIFSSKPVVPPCEPQNLQGTANGAFDLTL